MEYLSHIHLCSALGDCLPASIMFKPLLGLFFDNLSVSMSLVSSSMSFEFSTLASFSVYSVALPQSGTGYIGEDLGRD